MKLICILIVLSIAITAHSQPKLITQAVVSTTTNIIAPDDEDVQNLQNQGGGMNFRNMMDGETKSTTYIKDDLVKTVLKSDVGRSAIFRNNNTRMTTTIIEMMGSKMGFFVSDSEQTILRKRMDSTMEHRRRTDSNATAISGTEPQTEIVYSEETKKIAGYNCKKAFVITTRLLGLKDSVAVWYTPEIKFQNVPSTGGISGFGNAGNISGIDKIDGFVMAYNMNMRRGRRMEVSVTKIDLQKEIAEKEFEIPKDVEIKPMKEMQNMFRGNGFPRPN